jgi:putative pyruvate formate lyase activating enzyme
MDQYRPCYRADEVPDIGRRPTSAEICGAIDAARRHGIHRLDPGW